MPYGDDAVRLRAFKANFGTSRLAGAPATLYLALRRQATVGQEGTVLGTEPDSTGGYARVAFANTDAEWTYSTVGGDNTNEKRFPSATGLYSITAALNQWSLHDNAAGGALIAFGALTSTITVTGAGDVPVIPVGALDLSENA